MRYNKGMRVFFILWASLSIWAAWAGGEGCALCGRAHNAALKHPELRLLRWWRGWSVWRRGRRGRVLWW